MASLFDRIKKDVRKGIKEGITAVKEGANAVSEKMEELTTEGKRQYKMHDLRSKIQTQMTELGGRVYELLSDKKSPAADSKVKAVFLKIQRLDEQLSKFEEGKKAKAQVAPPKKPAKKVKETPKATPKKTASRAVTAVKTVKNAGPGTMAKGKKVSAKN